MKFVICDDNQDDTRYVKKLVNDYFLSSNKKLPEVVTYLPNELISSLAVNGCNFDVIILNTHFHHGSGIDLAKDINRKNPNCIIIYISNSVKTTEQIYETAHIYFILKSNIEKFLPKALSKAENILYERSRRAFVCLKGKGITYQLSTDTIKYFEVNGHKIYVYTTQQEYLTNCPLSSLARKLPPNFARTHNSYILNLEYIHAVYSDHIQLIDENIIPISRTYKKPFQIAYRNYLSHSFVQK